MSVRIIVLGFVLGPAAVLAALGLLGYWRKHCGFRAEYRRLVESTPTVRPDRVYRSRGEQDLFPADAPVDGWDCTGIRAPIELPASDHEYYETCWTHIIGTFEESPGAALDLAGHLTANLLLNRGIADAGSERPGELPAQWRFPTAEGYRVAQHIVEASRVIDLPTQELSKALMLYRALFEEVLAAPTSPASPSSTTDAQL
ncbi:MAG TPA: hypothetical protein VGM10_29820 [Actinocrinis sp.]|jgi:hypothetical protein